MYSCIKWDDTGTLTYLVIVRIKGINNVMELEEFLDNQELEIERYDEELVRKSAPIKHVSLQMNTLIWSLRGFLKINEIICVTWL